QLVATWQPGKLLVHFFGDHSTMWVQEGQLEAWGSPQDEPRLHALLLWGRQKHRCVHCSHMPLTDTPRAWRPCRSKPRGMCARVPDAIATLSLVGAPPHMRVQHPDWTHFASFLLAGHSETPIRMQLRPPLDQGSRVPVSLRALTHVKRFHMPALQHP